MPYSKTHFLILFIALLNVSFAHGQRRVSEPFDVLHYKYEIALNDTTDEISVNAQVTIVYPDSIPPATVLDLANKTTVGFGMKVSTLSMNGALVDFTHQSDLLNIATPSSTQKGDTMQITMSYSGIADEGLVISKNAQGNRTFFAEHWPNRAHRWLPVIDHPSEKATCEFVVTATAKYGVVANGDKQSEQVLEDGNKQTAWKMSDPIPAKVMVIGVAEFNTRVLDKNGMITVWAYKSKSDQTFSDFSDAPVIYDILTDLLGEYPFSKCDQVESTTRWGGLENAGNIFYPESSLTGAHTMNNVIAHEIGHQWFGDAVSEADWKDVWISEGFASFLENYYVLEYLGKDGLLSKLEEEEKKIMDYQDEYPARTIVQTDVSDLEQILSPLTYEKAAWVLRALSHKVGHETFRQIIVTFYERYKYGNASTQDFINVANEISLLDLDIFFQQWFYMSGAVDIVYHWKYKKGNLIIEFEQKSTQVYELDLDIQLRFSNMTFKVEHVQLTQRSQKIEIATDKPTGLQLDPLNIILGNFSQR